LTTFLLFIKGITRYNKKNIDQGNTPLDVYKICSCIREVFCLSYNLRKDNELYVYVNSSHLAIHIKGEELKFMGTDERSQALLLRKALDKSEVSQEALKYYWIKSTPGILIRNFETFQSFISFVFSLHFKNIIVIVDERFPQESPFLVNKRDYPRFKKFNELSHSRESIYILPLSSSHNILLIEFFKILGQIFPTILNKTILTSLNNINASEDKILYINFQNDQ